MLVKTVNGVQFFEIPGHSGYWINRSGTTVLSYRKTGTSGELYTQPKTLSQFYNNKDRKYLSVHIAGKAHGVHVLVALTFHGQRPSGKMACHNNGKHTDNRRSNIRWDTHQSNCLDVRKHGIVRGERNANSKLTEIQVSKIKRMLEQGHSIPDLATEYKVCFQCIRHIKIGLRWKHVA